MLALIAVLKASLAGAPRTAPAQWGYVLLCTIGFTHGDGAVENAANSRWIDDALPRNATLAQRGVTGPLVSH